MNLLILTLIDIAVAGGICLVACPSNSWKPDFKKKILKLGKNVDLRMSW